MYLNGYNIFFFLYLQISTLHLQPKELPQGQSSPGEALFVGYGTLLRRYSHSTRCQFFYLMRLVLFYISHRLKPSAILSWKHVEVKVASVSSQFISTAGVSGGPVEQPSSRLLHVRHFTVY